MLVHEPSRFVYVLLRPDSHELLRSDVLNRHRCRVPAFGYHVSDDVAVGDYAYGPLTLDDRERTLLLLDHPLGRIHYARSGLDGHHSGDHSIPYLRHIHHSFLL